MTDGHLNGNGPPVDAADREAAEVAWRLTDDLELEAELELRRRRLRELRLDPGADPPC